MQHFSNGHFSPLFQGANAVYNSIVINLIALLLTTFNLAYAVDDHCEYFKYCGSGSSKSSKSSSQSYPSASLASSFNPSNISKIKGIGVETLFQPSNPVGFGLATGTGKFGGALISPHIENSFFGNRSMEIDQEYLQRRIDKKRYQSKKLSFAFGANLITKNNYSIDLGVSFKRHSEIKKINPGAGLSLSFYVFNVGMAYYKDDTKLNFGSYGNLRSGNIYASEFGGLTYQENFSVQTFSFGFKLGKVALDYGRIHSAYNFYQKASTDISIYSGAWGHKNFLFNFAYRSELSPNLAEKNGVLLMEEQKKDFYFGVQYMFNKHVVLGAGYNTFLLKELSATVTLYL